MGLVGLVSSRFCLEIISNLTGTFQTLDNDPCVTQAKRIQELVDFEIFPKGEEPLPELPVFENSLVALAATNTQKKPIDAYAAFSAAFFEERRRF